MTFRTQKKTEQYQIKEVSLTEWNSLWLKVSKSNLLQSWQYGAAKEQAEKWKACRFAISDNTGQPVALSQILTRSWPIVGGIARLNRGPLLLNEYKAGEEIEVSLTILKLLLKEMQKKRCWVVQIAPELPDSDFVKGELKKIGLNLVTSIPWASGLIDLKEKESKLLMTVDGKWRNSMRKGEKLGVVIKKVNPVYDNNLNSLLASYTELQNDRKFQGLSEPLIWSLAQQADEKWSFDLFMAYESDSTVDQGPIGQLVTIRHGDTSIYLIGNANDQGRKMQASSLLLWHSMIDSKKAGCSWFDIGGLNSSTPKGIKEFKKGLNATPYALAGEFRGFLMPWKKFPML